MFEEPIIPSEKKPENLSAVERSFEYLKSVDGEMFKAIQEYSGDNPEEFFSALIRVRETIQDTISGKPVDSTRELNPEIIDRIVKAFGLDGNIVSMDKIQEIVDANQKAKI